MVPPRCIAVGSGLLSQTFIRSRVGRTFAFDLATIDDPDLQQPVQEGISQCGSKFSSCRGSQCSSQCSSHHGGATVSAAASAVASAAASAVASVASAAGPVQVLCTGALYRLYRLYGRAVQTLCAGTLQTPYRRCGTGAVALHSTLQLVYFNRTDTVHHTGTVG